MGPDSCVSLSALREVDIVLKMRAEAIITRDEGFPETDMIRVRDFTGFFEWLEHEKGISYADVPYWSEHLIRVIR